MTDVPSPRRPHAAGSTHTSTIVKIRLGIEVTVSLLIMGLALRLLPFRRLARLLQLREAGPLPTEAFSMHGLSAQGQSSQGSSTQAPSRASRADDIVVRRLGIYIERVAARLYPRRPCLASALAGRWLLALHGRTSEIVLGVANGESGTASLSAHAWLMSGDAIVTGRKAGAAFVPVARLVPATSSIERINLDSADEASRSKRAA